MDYGRWATLHFMCQRHPWHYQSLGDRWIHVIVAEYWRGNTKQWTWSSSLEVDIQRWVFCMVRLHGTFHGSTSYPFLEAHLEALGATKSEIFHLVCHTGSLLDHGVAREARAPASPLISALWSASGIHATHVYQVPLLQASLAQGVVMAMNDLHDPWQQRRLTHWLAWCGQAGNTKDVAQRTRNYHLANTLGAMEAHEQLHLW
jgi:hypothetical protein